MRLIEAFESLHTEELHEDTILLYEMMPPFPKNMDRRIKLNIHFMAAHAYHQELRFILAAKAYQEAIRTCTNLPLHCVVPKRMREGQLRYRLSRCYIQMERYADALQELQQVPREEIKAKHKSLLIRLNDHLESRKEEQISLHKDVVDLCSNAITSLVFLAKGGIEKNNDRLPLIDDLPILNVWFSAQIKYGKKDWLSALTLLSEHLYLNCRFISLEMARIYNILGMRDECLEHFKTAFDIDSENKDGMGIYATLLGCCSYDSDERLIELEELVTKLSMNNDSSPELLIACGHLHKVRELRRRDESSSQDIRPAMNMEVPLHFAHRASMTGLNRTSEAIILKCQILNEMERHEEVLHLAAHALNRDPHCLDLYDIIVATQVHLKREESARISAYKAKSSIGGPRTYFMYFNVINDITKDDKNNPNCPRERSTKLLREIVKLYPYFVDGVMAYAEVLSSNQQFDEAIKILKDVIKLGPFFRRVNNGMVNKFIADCQMSKKEFFHSYRSSNNAALTSRSGVSSPMASLNTMMDGDGIEWSLPSLDNIIGVPQSSQSISNSPTLTYTNQVTPQTQPPNTMPPPIAQRRRRRNDDIL